MLTIVTTFPQLVMAQTSTSNPIYFTTYSNPGFGISIQYPSLWHNSIADKAFSNNDGDDLTNLFHIKPGREADRDEIGVSILYHKLSTPKIFLNKFNIFDEFISQRALLKGFTITHLTSLLGKKLPEFVFVKGESGETTIGANNNTAQKIVYTYREGKKT